MEGLGINLGYLIVQIIAFIVIYTLMTRFVYDPLMRSLSERRARIAKGLEDAAAAANARRNAEAEAEKVLAAARADAAKVIEEARGRGEEVARQVEAEARAEAEKIRADAREAATAERDQQLAGLRGQVGDISVAIARRLIGESLDAKRQQAAISDFFTRLPAEARNLSGAVEVTSAMPLADAEKSRIQKDLGASSVTFVVEPHILGGLIVRSGDRVIDGSIRSGLNDLAATLA
jgi:F-type H+-transporting ATPase subunit b